MQILYASVLAAGQSSRFGRIKQLEQIAGLPMLQHSLASVIELRTELLTLGYQLKILLILGAYFNKVVAVISDYCQLNNITIVNNKSWKIGLSSSIHTAVNHIETDVTNNALGLLISLADQPYISSKDLKSVILAGVVNDKVIASSIYSKHNGENTIKGVPAYFGQQYFDALLALKGDQGAGKLLNSLDGVGVVSINNLVDIDYPEQIEN